MLLPLLMLLVMLLTPLMPGVGGGTFWSPTHDSSSCVTCARRYTFLYVPVLLVLMPYGRLVKSRFFVVRSFYMGPKRVSTREPRSFLAPQHGV